MQESINLRNSTFELMRIIAMGIIVFYHILCAYLYYSPNACHIHLLEALLPTIHIGVLLFVLISGYFGIHASLKGVLRLLFMVAIYYLPLEIFCIVQEGESTGCQILHTLHFIGYTPYWFVRTYLILYIFSPILNSFWETSPLRKRWIIVVLLIFVSLFIGNSLPWKGLEDSSLAYGKNLVTFASLYYIGRMLNEYETHWQRWSIWILMSLFIFYNVSSFCILNILPTRSYVWELANSLLFNYNSLGLLINALLLFIIIGHLHFSSSFVNEIAGTMFAVYIIHCHPRIETEIIRNIANYCGDLAGGGYVIYCYTYYVQLLV